jgi:hypothetical protein
MVTLAGILGSDLDLGEVEQTDFSLFPDNSPRQAIFLRRKTMTEHYPTKSAERDARRRERDEQDELRRNREIAEERERNADIYQMMQNIENYACHEPTIRDALLFILERLKT